MYDLQCRLTKENNLSTCVKKRVHTLKPGWVYKGQPGKNTKGYDIDLMKSMAIDGVFYKDIGKVFGLSQSSISIYLKSVGYSKGKYATVDVDGLQKMLDLGIPVTDIADTFGCTGSNIYYLISKHGLTYPSWDDDSDSYQQVTLTITPSSAGVTLFCNGRVGIYATIQDARDDDFIP